MSEDLVPMGDRRGLEHWFQNSIFKVWGTGSQTLFIVVLGTGIQNTFIWYGYMEAMNIKNYQDKGLNCLNSKAEYRQAPIVRTKRQITVGL